MKQLPVYILVVVLLGMTSCDGTNEPATTECPLEHFVKLQTGNWWVYEHYRIDRNGVKINGTDRIDSIVVEGTEIKLGRTAYMMVNYSTNDGGATWTRDTVYWSVDGNIVSIGLLNALPEFCNCLDDAWLPFADCSREAWTSLDTTVETSFTAIDNGVPVSGRESRHVRIDNARFCCSCIRR